MKKIISSILIPSLLLYLLGCYSTREITKEEFKNQVDKGKVTLLTKEPKTYELDAEQYLTTNDTIIVLKGTKTIDVWKGSKVIKNGSEVIFSGRIPLEDVTLLELKELETLPTILSIVGAGLVLLGLVFVFSLGDFNLGNKGLLSTAK